MTSSSRIKRDMARTRRGRIRLLNQSRFYKEERIMSRTALLLLIVCCHARFKVLALIEQSVAACPERSRRIAVRSSFGNSIEQLTGIYSFHIVSLLLVCVIIDILPRWLKYSDELHPTFSF